MRCYTIEFSKRATLSSVALDKTSLVELAKKYPWYTGTRVDTVVSIIDQGWNITTRVFTIGYLFTFGYKHQLLGAIPATVRPAR